MPKYYVLKVRGENRTTGKGINKTRVFTTLKEAKEKLGTYYNESVLAKNDWWDGTVITWEAKDGEYFPLPDKVKKSYDHTPGASHD